jgi:ATP-dependent RNA helicase DeaD
MTTITFKEMDINPNIKRAIEDLGYVSPTPIQERSIPIVLEGRDMIGQAQTGTGKTAAFSIPMVEKINPEDPNIQSLILCPTRELAIQVTEEIRKLYKYLENLKVVPVYGGQSYDIQIRALKKRPQIIVGTPGRIIDLMKRSLLKFENINMVILDEADEMLKMGFQEDLETILEKTPATRQTVMFSATMPTPILTIANKYLKNYELIKIESKAITVDKIEQSYYVVKNEQKIDLLIRLFDYNQFNTAIVFCNTKKDVDELVVALQENEYVVEGLHGDLKQGQRDRVMNSFRSSNVQILVATDVAARGLDVEDVDAVFNYDIPQEEEIYVHRIGRTGRAGRHGKSFTFITRRQIFKLRLVEKYINRSIPEGKIPTIEEVKSAKTTNVYHLVKERIEATNNLNANPLMEKLLEEGFTENQVFNALIDLLSNDKEKDYNEISTTDERSFDKKRDRKRDRDRNDNRRSGKKANADNRISQFSLKKEHQNKKVVVYINAGSKQNVKVSNVLTVLGKHKVNRKDIGNIEINKKGTYVELNSRDAEKFTQMGTVNIANQDVNTQIIQ